MGIVQRQSIRNSVITYLGIAIGAISLIIIQPRFLTKEEIGLTRLLFYFSALLATLAPLGTNSTIIRFFPYFRNRDQNHYGFFGFMLIFPLIGYLILGFTFYLLKDYIISKYIGQSKLFTDYFYYIFPLTFFLTFISVLTAYSYSIYRTSVPALINDVLVRIGSIILFTIYFIKWIDRDQFILLFVLIYGTQFLVLICYLFYEDRPSLKIKWEMYQEHTPIKMFMYGLALSMASAASMGLKYLDSVMLGTYKPKDPSLNALDIVGIYSVAAFVALFVEAPINALEKIMVPKMADGWKRNDLADIQQMYYKSAKYLFLLGGFLFLMINLNIDSLFQLIPDKHYSTGKGVVFIISLGTIINMATGNNDGILYTSNRYRFLVWLLLGVLILAYCNYSIFIPLFGMEGAAVATALSSLIYNFMKALLIWRFFHMQPFSMGTIKVAVAILITGSIVYFIPSVHNVIADIAIRSSLIAAIFGGLVYTLNIIPEFHHLIPFLKKKN